MKATLEFNLPEEREEFEAATNGSNCKAALWNISQEIFRPARKHGYSGRIQQLLDEVNVKTVIVGDGEFKYEAGIGDELIHELEKKFFSILEEYEIKLF